MTKAMSGIHRVEAHGVPHEGLAQTVRETCESYWHAAGGLAHGLHLHLKPIFLMSGRAGALRDAVGLLLQGGLSPGFSPRRDHLGISLWLTDPTHGVLLIADDGDRLTGEPLTTEVARARSSVLRVGCRLVWVPARGTVWRIQIPISRHLDVISARSLRARTGT